MSESLKITYGEGLEFEATPENTVLYTFLGQTAIGSMLIENSSLNHVYLQTGDGEEAETTKGMYLFEQFHGEQYKLIAEFVMEHEFPQLLNMRHIPECDLRSYMNYQEQAVASFASELPDSIPEDFK